MGRNIPPYAILSHVWELEEVAFLDIDDIQRARHMRGFEKIRLSCQQARRQGLCYVWVDTCCIDKTSSSELSEAINSMFKWYRDAAVCYAYLSTTSHLGNDGDNDPAAFRNSRWLTRGWTLQELIGPKHIEFYGKSWNYLGTKLALRDEISSLTKIPKRLLQYPHVLSSYSIAKRMSWASERITTRLEDQAYSLLGIFNIHMPLLYGEGRMAFLRLQEEILRRSDDESLFVWDGAFLREDTKLDMLAPDAAAFIASGNVELLPIMRDSSQFSVSNKGLHMLTPLIPDPSSEFHIAVLNCHYENDFTGYIGVRLRRLMGKTSDALHYCRLGIVVVPEALAQAAQLQHIIVCTSETQSNIPQQAFVEVQLPLTLEAQFKFPHQVSCEITPFFPAVLDGDCFWNPKTSVLRIEAYSWPAAYLKMGFSFYYRMLNWGFVVAYALPWRGRQGILVVKASTSKDGYDTWLACMNDKRWTIAHASILAGGTVEVKNPPFLLNGAGRPFEGDWHVVAEVHEEARLGQDIWVLRTSICGSKFIFTCAMNIV